MVIDLKDGDCGVDTFLCAEKQVGNTKNGKLYYSLRLRSEERRVGKECRL